MGEAPTGAWLGLGRAQARRQGICPFFRKYIFYLVGDLPHCQLLSLPQHVLVGNVLTSPALFYRMCMQLLVVHCSDEGRPSAPSPGGMRGTNPPH